jgi:hypothetical protein
MATERILPASALQAPARPRHAREGVAGPMARPAVRPAVRPSVRPAVLRKEAVLSTPTRAGMLIGASAAIYAVTLAGVSVLQSDSDAALAASRQPYLEALAAARTANDTLEAAVAKADGATQALANDYAAAGQDITGYQARLDELAALVAQVQGSAAALPTRISLPSVTMHGSIGGGSSAPAARAKTKASGVP